MAKTLTAAALSLATVLTGCLSGVGVADFGGSADDSARLMPLSAGDPVVGTVRFFGYLDVTREPSDGSQEFDARFGRFDKPVPASVVRAALSLETPDTCEWSSRRRPIKIDDELAFPGHPYQFVDAGDAITITHSDRRYASLSRGTGDDGPQYETAMAGTAATFAKIRLFDVFVRTANLSATIPGAIFPPAGPLAIPSVSAVESFSLDADDRVAADTVFRWDPGDNRGAVVQISAGGGGRAVFCSALDDGEFPLPADLKQWLGTHTIPNPAAHRESVVFYQINNALIAVSQSTQY